MKKEVVVQMTNSTEATPIAHLVQLANQFQSQVYFEMDSKKVNAKSIMGVMALASQNMQDIVVCVEGSDEEEAFKAITGLLQ